MMWDSWNSAGSWAMVLLMSMFLAVIVIGVALLIRSFASPTKSAPAGASALEILDQRFAKGEIDREEYEERRRVLMGQT